MPTHKFSPELAKQTVVAVEVCLQEGFPPSEVGNGAKTSAIHEAARRLNIPSGTIRSRLRIIGQYHESDPSFPAPPDWSLYREPAPREHPERVVWDIQSGVVIVFSDAHYWPGKASTAHRALVKFCKEIKPFGIVANGDVFDGASVSRHAPIQWEGRPTVKQEIEIVQERLGEILKAAPKAKRAWSLGNHDARFESRLATVAPEYANVHGMHLKDHMPEFDPCWSVWINDNVVVKHRHKNGIHSAHNSTMWAGRTMVCGHLHSMKVTPLTDYNGTRFGVDTGTLADPFGRQFTDYMEDNPRNWRSGFAVLTFHCGRLLWPELVHVLEEGIVEFRGRVYNV